MIRRSRCLLLLVLLVLLNLVILSLLNYDPRATLKENLNTSLFDVRKILAKDANLENREAFNELVDSKFRHIYTPEDSDSELSDEKKDHLWLLDAAKKEETELVIPDYMIDPDNFDNPNLHSFDPRFTLNFVFNNLRRQIKRSGSLDGLQLQYFHWGDWVDLSKLNEYALRKEKESCSFFDLTTKSTLRNKKMELMNPLEFCIDDDKIDEVLNDENADPDFKEKLKKIKEEEFTTGFHVFKYGGRSRKKFKVLQAKSYLNEFMPPPLSIVFILPGSRSEDDNKLKLGGTGVHVDVSQETNDRIRIADSKLVTNYVKEFRREFKEMLDTSKDIIINIDRELQRLNDMVKEKLEITEESEVSYEKVLIHDQFRDNSSDILAELSKTPEESLSTMEKVYKDSLQMSLNEASPPKYFNEAKIVRKESNYALGGHYDWRFFNGIINYTDKQNPSLHGLIRTWLTFTNTYSLNTWIAHGSLLSWYWNGVGFPWDNDIDVQMPIADLHALSRKFNQSIIMDLGDGHDNEIRYGRYFLDCGTFISSRTKGNGNNNIDARFIDMDTGFYIDITGLALSDTKPPIRFNKLLPEELSRVSIDQTIGEIDRNNYLQAYNCRNNHFARLNELSPLRLTMVEGEPAYIPNDYGKLLNNEYGAKGLMAKKFKGYTFLPKLRIWVLTRNLNNFIRNKLNNGKRDDDEPADEDSVIKNLTDKDYLKLLFEQDDLLIEYLATRDLTTLHEDEIRYLMLGHSTEPLLLDEKKHLKARFPALRHDFFTYMAHRENYKYEDKIADILREVEIARKPAPPPEDGNQQQEPQEENKQPDSTAENSGPTEPQINTDTSTGIPQVQPQTDEHLENASINRISDLPPLNP